MTIAQETLDRWRAFAEQVRTATFSVRHAYARGQREQAQDTLQGLHADAIAAGLSLDAAGARTPPALPTAPAVPLHLLDTPKNRRYADALRAAWEAGLVVDRERYGERIGTDGCAQVVEMVLADVEMEIYGPQGRGEGVRKEG